MLSENGFGRFYQLKGSKATPPVGSKVFKESSFDWLADLALNAEGESDSSIIDLHLGVRGISCVGCVWLIETIFQQQAGAISVNIDTNQGAAMLRWESGKLDITAFAQEMLRLGYELTPNRPKTADKRSTNPISSRIGICGFFLLNTMLFTLPGYLGMSSDYFLTPLFDLLGALFATLSMVVGGSYFISRAVRALRRKVIHIDLPIALGLSVAYIGSILGWMSGHPNLIYFDFVATFVFLMLFGRWLQEYALERNRRHINERSPESRSVTVFGGPDDGASMPIEQIEPEQCYTIERGSINPVSARLLGGAASASLEWINGEAEPVPFDHGNLIPAGAINVGLEPITLRAEESWEESLLAELLKTPVDTFRNKRVQRILAGYLSAVLIIATIGGLAWGLKTWDLIAALQVFISVLIVSCPCALGVALPLIDELCNAKLRNAGLFIKTATIWARLRQVKHIIFDKTGTLSLETPRLLNPEVLDSLSTVGIQALYALTQYNLHPVARSIRENLLVKFANIEQVPFTNEAIKECVGNGVYFRDENDFTWSLGKPGWRQHGFAACASGRSNAQADLSYEGHTIAAFAFQEDLRDETRATIRQMRHYGYEIAILSGDIEANVHRVAARIGVAPGFALARCTPRAKARWIHTHARNNALMIGDGANDRLAFDQAVCRGTPIVDRSLLESSADFFFFGRSLASIPKLFETARVRQLAVLAVLGFAITYNLIAVTISLMGAMHPLLAAILMPISSLIALAIPWVLLQDRDC